MHDKLCNDLNYVHTKVLKLHLRKSDFSVQGDVELITFPMEAAETTLIFAKYSSVNNVNLNVI